MINIKYNSILNTKERHVCDIHYGNTCIRDSITITLLAIFPRRSPLFLFMCKLRTKIKPDKRCDEIVQEFQVERHLF